MNDQQIKHVNIYPINQYNEKKKLYQELRHDSGLPCVTVKKYNGCNGRCQSKNRTYRHGPARYEPFIITAEKR
jgi:hypothetical protein